MNTAISQHERTACPLYTAIGVIEGRWKPMLFQRLAERPRGFGELRRAIPGVAAKVLREQLRQMQADGLVVRRPLTPAHAGVRYGLTPYGRTLWPVFDALWRWGTKHLARRNAGAGTLVAAPRAVVHAHDASDRHRIDAGAREDGGMSADDRTSGEASDMTHALELRPVGTIQSTLSSRRDAPKQGDEGAPDAWLEVLPWAADALLGLTAGDEIIVITWLDRARRDTFQVHPRSDPKRALTGVFATRSPDRPNPLGLHPVVIREIDGLRLLIGPIEALDGTPVVDIKSALPTRDTR